MTTLELVPSGLAQKEPTAAVVTASVRAIALVGLEAQPVTVECSLGGGLPTFRLVGLPGTAVREAGERVRSAISRSGFTWPMERVVVNLAPAHIPKAGSGFDLAVALSVLAASQQLDAQVLSDAWVFGELGLDGTGRAVPGVLPVAQAVRARGGRLVVPLPAAAEAKLVDGLDVVAITDLAHAVKVLTGEDGSAPIVAASRFAEPPGPDLADVRGQAVARRAVELAATGGHHLLLAGPPGCGKSMLARRLPGILPPLSLDDALEVVAVQSVAGVRRPDAPLSLRPPFRDPHHTTSLAGLVGGGSGVPRPGELSLAHRGVLFLDELLETPRSVLDSLRQPLETGQVVVVRAAATVRYPARVQLVAATNPCPCGRLGSARHPCICRPDQIERYRSRLSGPLLDRFDLHVELTPVESDRLAADESAESSTAVASRVIGARAAAADRFGPNRLNRDIEIARLRQSTHGAAIRELARAVEVLGLSARAFDRCLRVGRTIADLAGSDVVTAGHVEEALSYRLARA